MLIIQFAKTVAVDQAEGNIHGLRPLETVILQFSPGPVLWRAIEQGLLGLGVVLGSMGMVAPQQQ